MGYTAKELKEHIGKIGIFYNEDDQKILCIGKLIAVTPHGNCECDDGWYFDEFEPKTKHQLRKLINQLNF